MAPVGFSGNRYRAEKRYDRIMDSRSFRGFVGVPMLGIINDNGSAFNNQGVALWLY